jgi:hypothetical protein
MIQAMVRTVTAALFLTAWLTGRLPAGANDDRDAVHLKERSRPLMGRVLLELDDKVLLIQGSRERWIDRKDIDRVESVAASHRELMQRLLALSKETPAKLMELVRFCTERKLEQERLLLSWRILLLEPEHQEANQILGHLHRSKGWLIKVGSAYKPLAEVEKFRTDWGEAWDLRSEHFQVRCDAGLATTIDILLELEFLYHGIYATFQKELELRELLEPIQAYVYKDRDRFPKLSSTSGAFYASDERILYTWMRPGGEAFALFHEGTHAILHHLAGYATRSRGSLPAWLDEAWAEYMEGVMVRAGAGRARLDPKRRLAANLRVLATIEDPYGLHRVLNFKTDDFYASTKQREKYAQCYALFLFCLDGVDGQYRKPFFEYLREALAGQGQASTFRRIFRADLDLIEKAYLLVR